MLLLQLICTFLYRTLHLFPFYPGSLRPFLYSHPIIPSTPYPTTPVSGDRAPIRDSRPRHSQGHEACLSPPYISAVVHDSIPPRAMVSPAAILSRDSILGRYSSISDLVGSPSDLWISSVTLGPSTFGFGHRIGSLRIYLGSSLDLFDSSFVLEIGPSSEILRISRPFTHPVSLPLPLPSSRIPPSLPPSSFGLSSDLLCLRGFPSLVDPQPFPLRPSPRPYACPSQVVFRDFPHLLSIFGP